MGDLSSQADGGGASGGGGAGFGGGGGVDPDVLSMLFFHAVTLQAVLSGFISGYIRNADIVSGVKFAVVLMTLALGCGYMWDNGNRAQTPIDFTVGAGVFLLTLAFVIAFVPTLFRSLLGGGDRLGG